MEKEPDLSSVRTVEEIVEVDGKKMKKIKKYGKKLVKEYIPKGLIARKKMAPFGLDKPGEPARPDKNPVFFEIHGKGKQIKVKVDTLPRINQQLKDIDRAIEGEKVRIKELDDQGEFDFSHNFQARENCNENAVVRVSNIPDLMSNHEVRALFSKYGYIIMMTMPKPVAQSEEQKRNQKRAEKRQKKQEKKMKHILGKKDPDKVKEEESKKVAEREAEAERTHRGFAYVYFKEPEAAAQAIKEVNDQPFYSQIISVKKARPRPPK
jgi:RNA recognition motif-containing protein